MMFLRHIVRQEAQVKYELQWRKENTWFEDKLNIFLCCKGLFMLVQYLQSCCDNNLFKPLCQCTQHFKWLVLGHSHNLK